MNTQWIPQLWQWTLGTRLACQAGPRSVCVLPTPLSRVESTIIWGIFMGWILFCQPEKIKCPPKTRGRRQNRPNLQCPNKATAPGPSTILRRQTSSPGVVAQLGWGHQAAASPMGVAHRASSPFQPPGRVPRWNMYSRQTLSPCLLTSRFFCLSQQVVSLSWPGRKIKLLRYINTVGQSGPRL